jgi:hypothetical protein
MKSKLTVVERKLGWYVIRGKGAYGPFESNEAARRFIDRHEELLPPSEKRSQWAFDNPDE